MINWKKLTSFLLSSLMILFTAQLTPAATNTDVRNAINDTASYLLNTVYEPQVGQVGGEWTIIGLARSDYKVPQSYYDDYYAAVVRYLRSNDGILDNRKYTEYSRVILALTAIGKDPLDVGGYNLLEPLGDFEKTVWQGINGSIFALLALDSGSYDMPVNKSAKVQATREMYVNEILSRQLSNGGFSQSDGTVEPDITGMALQALAKYTNRADVKTAVDKALGELSRLQDDDGGFEFYNADNLESVAQVLMALCELGVNINDSRFVKNGNTLLDNLLTYYDDGNGFIHTSLGDGKNIMSTEQAFYTLVNLMRVSTNNPSLYRMIEKKPEPKQTPTQAPAITQAPVSAPKNPGLPGKNRDVKSLPVISPGKTFADISNHKAKSSIEALASRGIINGINDTSYDPNADMTRAQFATIVVRSLGLETKTTGIFRDVPASSSYAAYIDTAFSYGIVNGVTSNTFAPDRTITKQEAAVMVSNAAKLCGMNTTLNTTGIRDMLAQFTDYTKTAEWARNSLAFCYKENILSQNEIEINPLKSVSRADIAEMLYSMLISANLI